MSQPPPHPAPGHPGWGAPAGHEQEPALSFGLVADAYDRARPGYPQEAVDWVLAPTGTAQRVLELGAGTGKLTDRLHAPGRTVIATDPTEPMLRRLAARLPEAHAVQSGAERLPLRSGAVDVVLAAQAFHWFDPERALPEVARVLRPGGALGLLWNQRDERIPWVRRLGTLLGPSPGGPETAAPTLDASGFFGPVETSTFRFWQPLTRDSLRDLVASRSNVALMSHPERDRVLRKVDALYDDYGRGADGMLLPYVTHCFRTVVLDSAAGGPGPAPSAASTTATGAGGRCDGSAADEPADATGRPAWSDPMDTDGLLIDFR